MVKRLDSNDRNILEFRPEIDFVEPDQEPQAPNPVEVTPEVPQVEDAEAFREQVKRLAQAVNTLAAAVQGRADQRAQNMVIKLDPVLDADTIQAMRRQFPTEINPDTGLPSGTPVDPTQITYAQYRACKDFLRNLGEDFGRRASISPDEVEAVRDDAARSRAAAAQGRVGGGGGAAGLPRAASPGASPGEESSGAGAGADPIGRQSSKGNAPITGVGAKLGGFNTEESRTGGLRPELDDRTRLFDPIDIDDLQINMICILVNFIWKNFILLVFNAAKIPVAGVSIGSLLPKKLCDPKIDIEIPGLAILGIIGFQKPQAPQIPEGGPEI